MPRARYPFRSAVRPSVHRRSLRSLSHTGTAAAVSLAPSTVYRARARSRPVSLSVVAAVRHLRSHTDSLEPPPPLRAVPTVSFAVCAIPSDQSDRSCRRVRSRVGCRFRRRFLRDFFFFPVDFCSIGVFAVSVCCRRVGNRVIIRLASDSFRETLECDRLFNSYLPTSAALPCVVNFDNRVSCACGTYVNRFLVLLLLFLLLLFIITTITITIIMILSL